MTQFPAISRQKLTLLAGAGVALSALIIVGLTVQHLRHGWPFSLHHGQPAAEAGPAPSTAAGHAEHDRVPVQIDEDWVARLDMQTSAVVVETVAPTVRAVATVVPDEQRLAHIHARASGWIEELYVSTTGERVRKGQPLAGLFSQDLYASQIEYITILKQADSRPASAVQESARQRLQVLGMSDAEIRTIEKQGRAQRLVTLTSPLDGVVLRRSVSPGTAVDPSTELMVIADLSRVWIIAELPERDAALAKEGARVMLDIPATGLAPFSATISFLHPTLDERTRSRRARIPVDNPDRLLLPGMTAQVSLQGETREALTVPRDALVDTGEHQHVFVETGAGHFTPRPVRTGVRLTDRVEILEGLVEGERVVTSGVFLIDSESRLRGSGGGTGHAGHGSRQSDDNHGGAH
jgi:membrane fusion protein, copper/silver efflux system